MKFKVKNSGIKEGQPIPKKLLLISLFDIKACCLSCSHTISQREFKDHEAIQVMIKNRDFDKEVCDKRKGTLAISEEERITFATDLHVIDAVCHAACNSSFRTGKDLPRTYTGYKTNQSPGLRKTTPFSKWQNTYIRTMKNKLR